MTNTFGLTGAAYAVLLSSSVTLLYFLYHAFAILRLHTLDFLRVLLPAAILTVVLGLVILVIKRFFAPMDLLTFLATGIACLVVYVGLDAIMWWKFKTGLLSNITSMRR